MDTPLIPVPGRPAPGPQPSILFLAALAALATIGMHIFIPVLPEVAADFGTTTAQMQMTITVYMVGLGTGQVIYGVLSDRFGRRPVLLGGLLVFVFGLLLAVPVTSFWLLLAARFIQSVGACAGLVLGRAMIQDSSEGAGIPARLAVVTMVMSMTPMLAPLLGIAIAGIAGWRAVFPVLAALVLVLILKVLPRIPETHMNRGTPETFRQLFRGLLRLGTSRNFVGFALCGGFLTIGGFVMLGALPYFVKDVIGAGDGTLSMLFLLVASGVTGGSIVSRVLSRWVTPLGMCRIGCSIAVLASAAMIFAATRDTLSLPAILPAFILATLAAGLASPNAVAGCMASAPGRAGTASAGYGLFQMTVGALLTAAPSLIGNQYPPTMAGLLCLTSAMALAGALFVVRGPGRRAA
ncbi:Bcr/CflA family efflux MFS transporter [Pseudooceanicola sp. 216_PA32_1]|uniref:Bcr/CflA family efflux transporter n=1 Tax=Pseudooceanicola pacificus TaxID=2676438 RepID=A0A844W1Y5_9RHOB|nr:Bcr/CflA family efflux MFS transporter [Pseudooceanicola pacificus]MWB78146.1 Bcr/CflA family efflux MFS transporter [Pseudooceanicola pacificus]